MPLQLTVLLINDERRYARRRVFRVQQVGHGGVRVEGEALRDVQRTLRDEFGARVAEPGGEVRVSVLVAREGLDVTVSAAALCMPTISISPIAANSATQNVARSGAVTAPRA